MTYTALTLPLALGYGVNRIRPEDVPARIATPEEQAQLRLGNMALGGKRKGRKAPPPLNVLFFARLCEQGGVPRPVGEYRFHPTRMWRFDVAWVNEHVALEVHGGNFMGGRHVRGRGAAGDYEKLNEAQLKGWIVLQVLRSDGSTDDWMNMTTVALVRDAIALQASRKPPATWTHTESENVR